MRPIRGDAPDRARRRDTDRHLVAALDSTPVGLLVLDHNRVLRHMTKGAAWLLGLPCLPGRMTLPALLARCRALDAGSRQLVAGAFKPGGDGEKRDILITCAGPFPRRTLAVDVRRIGRQGWVMSLQDVTQSRQTQDWLLEHVSTDPVTGLWNRQHFTLMLHDLLAARDEAGPGPAVLLVNLQRFRHINETLGAFGGDTLLRMVANRLTATLEDDDMLARAAGNEFAVAIAHPRNGAEVHARAATLLEKLDAPYPIDSQHIGIWPKIGVALAPEDGDTASDLLVNAGLAMRAADGASRQRIRFFDTELTERAQRRRGLEADLRAALKHGEFTLHYQPQVDVRAHAVIGMEALLRWLSPRRGPVSPADFIPLAEDLGLIVDIGAWVLREACREAAGWPAEISVAVNASPLQFETGDFAATVAAALAESGLGARRLEIEITESLLLHDTGPVLASLAALQDLGVRLVLDDFGTGYASLSQLSRFRFDKIKIDRSFVSPVLPAPENAAIVRSIAALARSLQIPSTAEGVETQSQLDQITADGCTLVQGFFLSRPVPANAVPDVLARLHHPARAAA